MTEKLRFTQILYSNNKAISLSTYNNRTKKVLNHNTLQYIDGNIREVGLQQNKELLQPLDAA